MNVNKKTVLIIALLVFFLTLGLVLYPILSGFFGELNRARFPEQTSGDPTQKAKDFTVTDPAGNATHLSDFVGKPVVVNLWASWCDPCKSELPYFNDAYEKYKDEIRFMMIDLPDSVRETVASATAYAKKEGYSFPLYFDTEQSASNAYSVYSIPMTLFVTAKGELFTAYIGAMDEATLSRYLTLLLEETE